jgi:hypothetical protein
LCEYTTDGRRGYPVAELEQLTLGTAAGLRQSRVSACQE